MNNKEQYIEPLIKLIELNNDKTWLQTFLDLRQDAHLPGGGAGSLNDWGPYYSDKFEKAWYPELYKILRYLFDNNLPSEQLKNFDLIHLRNNIRIIRCLHCNKSYQHPSVFESLISLNFYAQHFTAFADSKSLLDLFISDLTINNQKTKEFRRWLHQQYELNDIKVYDFVNNNYICPHCFKAHAKTIHDLYIISELQSGEKEFRCKKSNAEWGDFEKV